MGDIGAGSQGSGFLFYLTYLHRELRRRLGRTVLTILGLAVGVSLVVIVSALSAGLDRAQAGILDPLEKVGTDLVVSRPVDVPVGGTAQGGASALVGGIPAEEVDALLDENQSLFQTDFSQLGKPGEVFERELFLPATLLTFPKDQQKRVEAIDGVDTVAGGLSLLAVHQKGKVPEIVATFETGGDTVSRDIDISPPSQAEWQSIASCVQRTGGGPSCLPGRFKRLTAAFTTPREVIKQILDPPQTDLATEPYTAAGVDLEPPRSGRAADGTPDIGVITPAQISAGSFFSGDPAEVVLAEGYLERKNLEVGGELPLNGKPYTIVGTARPPLGGQSADIYLPLSELQVLAGREDRVNTLFVRADSAADVPRVSKEIERVFPGAQVTSAKDLANQISGSLVDAGNLADRLGIALAAIALVSSVLIAVLLTLSSVAKRIRELGTLGALGWSKALIIRQVVAESFTQGSIGGVVGAALGVAVAAGITALAPELRASAAQQSGPLSSSFGLGRVLADEASRTITLSAPVRPGMVVIAVGLAVAGGLLAGLAGATRAARLRPADALRELG